MVARANCPSSPWSLRSRMCGIGALSMALLGSCRRGDEAVADAAPPPVLRAPAKESARAKDEMWRRATEGDPIELARLADREGAGGLLLGLEDGGEIGLTALAALPFADDAELAYQRLGEILRRNRPGRKRTVGPRDHRDRASTEAADRTARSGRDTFCRRRALRPCRAHQATCGAARASHFSPASPCRTGRGRRQSHPDRSRRKVITSNEMRSSST